MLMRLSKNTFVRQYGPFTYVLGRIRSYDQVFADAEVFFRWIGREPREKSEILTNICGVYEGTDPAQIAADFDEFFAPYYKEVIDRVHALGMHFWLHTCGNVEALLPRFIELGVDVIHPIQKYTMDEQRIARSYGGEAPLWAGVDVERSIPYGPPDAVGGEVPAVVGGVRRAAHPPPRHAG